MELLAGDERCWGRLRWLLDVATPTFTWPEAVHPRLRGGCMGDGHHGWVAADFLAFVWQVLLREDDAGVALLPLVPPGWERGPLEVTAAPTLHGAVSYRLEPDAGGVVLHWSCDRPGVRLTAPGLDPAWSTSERSGSASFALARAGGAEPST